MLFRSVHIFVVLSVMMTICGCQSTPGVPRTTDAIAKDDVKVPHRDTRQPTTAAGTKVDAQLDSAELWLESGDPYLARLTLMDIDSAVLEGDPAQRALRLQVQTDLALGLVEDAAGRLAGNSLAPSVNARLRADLCEREKQYGCVVQALVAAGEGSPPSQEDNDRIWAALLRTLTGQGALPQLADDVVLQGWLDLANLARNTSTLPDEKAAFEAWRNRYANHPAAQATPTALGYLLGNSATDGASVAVLLPLTGQLASIGRAVRDGMITAQLAEQTPSAPTLQFFDSAAQPLPALYEQSLQTDADLIVGPLVKTEVAALSALNPSIPVLALNYLDEAPSGPQFYQLGLAIEDEGRGIGQALDRLGYEKVLFITSSASWADRSLAAIQEEWHGEVNRIRVNNAQEMTDALGGALRATPSYRRKAELQSILSIPLQFTSGVRNDLQAIVALTDPNQTSTLGPAMTYHAVGGIGILAGTQSIRNNRVLASQSRALVTELPVMLGADTLNDRLRSTWTGQGADISFFALGADAYRVVRRLPARDAAPVDRTIWGATGLLSLSDGLHFRRTQLWGQYRGGRLVPAQAIP